MQNVNIDPLPEFWYPDYEITIPTIYLLFPPSRDGVVVWLVGDQGMELTFFCIPGKGREKSYEYARSWALRLQKVTMNRVYVRNSLFLHTREG